MMALAELLDRRLVDAAWTIAPAYVDRFGLTFHLAGPAGVAYPRLDFPAVVAHPSQLPAALRTLHGRAGLPGGRRLPRR